MRYIITVSFEDGEKTGEFIFNKPIEPETNVIVQTSVGLECAKVISSQSESEYPEKNLKNIRFISRIATKQDLQRFEENKEKEKEALPIGRECILKHKLDMKLINVHYTLDRGKAIFYFIADGRIDFRKLVCDLASIFHTRIEMRQIGVRDGSKMLGGLGLCGRALCCSSFLSGFHSVSIKMAKEQNISLNPSKLSGACGRLMCCLKYEQAAYEEFIEDSIDYGATVQTPDGAGTVYDRNLITQVYQVRLLENPDAPPRSYHKDKLKTGKK